MSNLGPKLSIITSDYPRPTANEEFQFKEDPSMDPEQFADINLELEDPSTMPKSKSLKWSDSFCSFVRYGGLLFGPVVFITDILYYTVVGFKQDDLRVAYLGFLILQPLLNFVCVLLFGTYLLNYTEYDRQRKMGMYVVGYSPCIAALASVKLIGFATLFSKFGSGVSLGIWILIIITPVFKTFPILLIQGLNNHDQGIWTTPFAMFCYVVAVLSCCKEVIELMYYLIGDLIFPERTEIFSYIPKFRAAPAFDKGSRVDHFGNCGWPALFVPFCGWNVLNCANLYKAEPGRFLSTRSYWFEVIACLLCLPPLPSILFRSRQRMSNCQLLAALSSCGAYPAAVPAVAIELLKA